MDRTFLLSLAAVLLMIGASTAVICLTSGVITIFRRSKLLLGVRDYSGVAFLASGCMYFTVMLLLP
jgi:hypothetical protein